MQSPENVPGNSQERDQASTAGNSCYPSPKYWLDFLEGEEPSRALWAGKRLSQGDRLAKGENSNPNMTHVARDASVKRLPRTAELG